MLTQLTKIKLLSPCGIKREGAFNGLQHCNSEHTAMILPDLKL